MARRKGTSSKGRKGARGPKGQPLKYMGKHGGRSYYATSPRKRGKKAAA